MGYKHPAESEGTVTVICRWETPQCREGKCLIQGHAANGWEGQHRHPATQLLVLLSGHGATSADNHGAFFLSFIGLVFLSKLPREPGRSRKSSFTSKGSLLSVGHAARCAISVNCFDTSYESMLITTDSKYIHLGIRSL